MWPRTYSGIRRTFDSTTCWPCVETISGNPGSEAVTTSSRHHGPAILESTFNGMASLRRLTKCAKFRGLSRNWSVNVSKEADRYTYRIEWSEEDGIHIARCLEFPSLAAHGHTADEALKEIRRVVEDSIEWIKEDGDPVPEPIGVRKYKGNLTLRVTPEMHRQLAIRSAEEGVSINKYILSRLQS